MKGSIKMLLDAPDEDFSLVEDNKTISTGNFSGGLIDHTRTSPEFMALDTQNKVNFGVFMTRYNVHEKQELSQGVALGKAGSGIIEKVFRDGDAFAAVNRINIMVSMTAIVLILSLFVIVAVVKFINFITSMLLDFDLFSEIKVNRCWDLFKYTLGLSLMTFLMKWFYDRCHKRIVIIQYYIK